MDAKSEKKQTKVPSGGAPDAATQAILRHWHEAVPDDRMAHLVRDAARGLTRALQFRLAAHGVSMGHWVFLRILWDEDGLSQRELAARAGLMESTTHTALRRMEALGFIERRKRPGDRTGKAVAHGSYDSQRQRKEKGRAWQPAP